MLTESFVAATVATNKAVAHASAALKDVGIFLQEFQPQSTFRQGFKKSSAHPGCVAISDSHIFAGQADKAVINVYSREKGNQEATVPFPERVHSLVYAHGAETLVIGTEGGRLILWEVATGRITNSAASHLQAVSCLCITPKNEYIISGSADSSVNVWSPARLVAFEHPSGGFSNDEPSNTPINTFSGHRSAITTIAAGHSQITTNFAVSAADDGTCYVWHVETCQILRTLLLPSFPISIALDPADRVVYFGSKEGRIQSWDIFQQAIQSNLSTSNSSTTLPIQLFAKDSWSTPSTDIGSVSCLTLSYDGTSLLSGHTTGTIIRWDAAKHRIVNEVTNLGQPVTNIEMLKPEGFPKQHKRDFAILQIIKPNLEFTSTKDSGSCGVPANYNLHVIIPAPKAALEHDEFEESLSGPGIPQAMLDAAVRSLTGGDPSLAQPSIDIAKTTALQDEIANLKQQVAALQSVEDKRTARKVARMTKRDELGLKKREAYFEAKKQGQDGDAAMKKWEKKEAELDRESDEEDVGVGEEMDIS